MDLQSSGHQYISCESLGESKAALGVHTPAPVHSIFDTQNEVLVRMRCDAMIKSNGGAACSNFIKNNLLGEIMKTWNICGDLQNIPVALCNVVEMALVSLEKRYLEIAMQNGDSSGASVVVALYLDGCLCISNVGDLQAVVLGENDRAIKVLKAHSSKNKKECMRIFFAGGNISKDGFFYTDTGLNCTRTIGSLQLKMRYPGILISHPETMYISLEQTEKNCVPSVLRSSGGFDIRLGLQGT